MAGSETTMRLENDIRELAHMCQLLEEYAEQNNLPPKALFDLNLALDELVTNIISYGYEDDERHEILVRLRRDGDMVHMHIEDDGIPFNPLDMPEPNVDAPMEERKIGGLGIHLVKRLMTSVEYERCQGKNILRITKDCAIRSAC